MSKLRVSAAHNKAVATRLRRTGHEAAFDREALEKAGRYTRSEYRKRFKTQGAWGNPRGAWAPVNPKYSKPPALMASGNLYRSWTVKGAKGNVSRIRRHGALFGSRYTNSRGANLASLHTTGYRSPGDQKRVPARKVVRVSAKNRRDYGEIVLDHIMQHYRPGRSRVDVST